MSRREEINSELEQIRATNGGMLKQTHVVEFARDPNTALHSQFQWDDSKAGEEFRLIQAARIIRAYVIKVSDDQRRPTRALVSIMPDRRPSSGLPGYRFIKDVLRDEDLRYNLLQTALMEFRALRRKYESLQELEVVWATIEEIERRHRREPPAAEGDRASAP